MRSARGASPRGSAFTSSIAPSRGGSISALVERPSAAIAASVAGEQVRDDEARAIARARCAPRSPARARTSARAALDADDVRAAPGDRQREVAEAAEEIGDALAGLRIEQRHRAAHQHAVDRRVDLRELGGRERRCVRSNSGSVYASAASVRIERHDRGRARRSAARTRRRARPRRRRARLVGARQRREDAQHERVHGFAAPVVRRDARRPRARSAAGASRIDRPSISARNARQQRRRSCGGSTWHSRMSATKLDLRSWKPTSTPPFLATSRTDSRARWR